MRSLNDPSAVEIVGVEIWKTWREDGAAGPTNIASTERCKENDQCEDELPAHERVVSSAEPQLPDLALGTPGWAR